MGQTSTLATEPAPTRGRRTLRLAVFALVIVLVWTKVADSALNDAGIVAALAVSWLLPGAASSALGRPSLGAGVDPIAGIAIEAILTAVLLIAVFGTAIDPHNLPWAGGAAVANGQYALRVEKLLSYSTNDFTQGEDNG